jgi:hypothetical protein
MTGGRFRHGTKLLRWRPDKAPSTPSDRWWRRGRPRLLPDNVSVWRIVIRDEMLLARSALASDVV